MLSQPIALCKVFISVLFICRKLPNKNNVKRTNTIEHLSKLSQADYQKSERSAPMPSNNFIIYSRQYVSAKQGKHYSFSSSLNNFFPYATPKNGKLQ